MIREHDVITEQEETIKAQDILIDWLLNQLYKHRNNNDAGDNCEMRNGNLRLVQGPRRRRASAV